MPALIFFCLLLAFCAPQKKSEFLQPQVKSMSGDCFTLNHGVLSRGSLIASNDTLVTAYNGKLQITFNDSDYIIISENAKVILQYTPLPLAVTILILHGKVYSNAVVLPRMGQYRVITNKIETSVRGTAFSVSVDDTDRTVIDVLEGVVKVADYDSLCPITVQGGDHAVINPGKFPCRIRDIRLQELKELVSWVGKSLMKLRKLDELGSNLNLLPKLEACEILPPQVRVNAEALKAPPLKRSSRKIKGPEPEFEEMQKARLKELEFKKLREEPQRSPADIAKVIAINQVRIHRLYNQFLKQKSFSGRVLIRFAIKPDGSVADPSIASSSTDTPEFDGELVKTLLTVKFNPIPGSSEQITVVYPFDFKM